MRKPLLIGLLVLIGINFLPGCKHEPPVAPSNPTKPVTNPGTGIDTGICFQRDILPIFISNCAKGGCHDAVSRADGYQFTDYNSIVSKDFTPGNPDECKLYDKITEDDADKRMPPPPNAPLTATQTGLIRRWIAEGAKNIGNCSTPCDSNNYTYSAAIKPMIDQYCKGCHNSQALSGGLSLDTYEGLKTVALNGKLLSAIRHDPGFSPMPKGGSKLSDCQVGRVSRWIANGALNN